MVLIHELFLANLTRDEEDAGTSATETSPALNLTVNIDGEDVFDGNFEAGFKKGWAAISKASLFNPPFKPFESSALTNSSIRLGIRTDDAWAPQHVLFLGQTESLEQTGSLVLPLAVETDLQEKWLSTDSSEGNLSMPLRLVGSGSSSTTIKRVLFLPVTGGGPNQGTDADIELKITAGGVPVVSGTIPGTPQEDFERGGNWYFRDVDAPFTRGDVHSNGGIKLRIGGPKGDDSWLPDVEGRPTEIVPLVSIPNWNMGKLSTQPSEGKEVVDLPLI
jgi:hypothetical protein